MSLPLSLKPFIYFRWYYVIGTTFPMNIKTVYLLSFILLLTKSIIGDEKNIEEVVVTGTLLSADSSNISPIEVITEKDYRSFNITNLAELSKYLNISSGSRFQTNALGGVDQGMSSIALRGLDQASTLIPN